MKTETTVHAMYAVERLIKNATEYSSKDGPISSASASEPRTVNICHQTLAGLIRGVCDLVDAQVGQVAVLEDCDMFSVTVWEDRSGSVVQVGSRAWKEWKEGRRRLWSCEYLAIPFHRTISGVTSDQLTQALDEAVKAGN